jgi:hypothetical protein
VNLSEVKLVGVFGFENFGRLGRRRGKFVVNARFQDLRLLVKKKKKKKKKKGKRNQKKKTVPLRRNWLRKKKS